mmetsp:Transcript_25995/g.65982  ORF Transcript_25995/g.65982 Transcript_25995/m.65982 type:complete len:146 (-) Transcript_25995:4104-4541(-)
MVRFKNRYLLLQLEASSDPQVYSECTKGLNARSMNDLFKRSVQSCFGEVGIGKVMGSLQTKFFSAHTGLLIVRTSRDQTEMVSAAIAAITIVNKHKARFTRLHLAGTIRSCQRAAIKHSRALLAGTTESEAKCMREEKYLSQLEH